MSLRRYRHWTQKDIAELRRLAREHVRVNAIARRLNRSVASVRARATLEGISLNQRARELLDEWWPVVEEYRAFRSQGAVQSASMSVTHFQAQPEEEGAPI
jgi:IS30 family transposase